MFLFLSTEIHTGIAIVPYMYNQAYMGIYQESIRFEDGQLFCDEELQAKHAEFAQVWLNNILAQGYLK